LYAIKPILAILCILSNIRSSKQNIILKLNLCIEINVYNVQYVVVTGCIQNYTDIDFYVKQ
jgi:hypothetical protein